MSAPQRIQLSRRKGFNLQSVSDDLNGRRAVNVARPSQWGNPWKVGEWSSTLGRTMSAADAVQRYRKHVLNGDGGWFARVRQEAVLELRGKNLACWCKPGQPCHADVLLELANS